MSERFTESVVADAALAWLEALGYAVLHGPDIAAGIPGAERGDPDYRDVVLEGRLRQALVRLNPNLPPEALEDAYRKLTRGDAPSLVERNRAAHRMLVDGVTVEYRRKDGSIAGEQARVIDFATPGNNDWLAVNQFTVAEGQHVRRPDVVLFVNGLALAVIELKNPADENATVATAFQQLQTYQAQIPALFASNAALVVSDGVQARIGSLGAGKEWFKPWRTITGREDASAKLPELQVVLEGVFEQRRFLDLLRQPPVQAADRADLRARLAVPSGGVVFTNIQKFFPESPSPQPSPGGRGGRMEVLSDRRNIVVIADEAHRSQYDFIDGFACHMRGALPHASFVGFTGTPIEKTDANTRAVFGDYISVYDIQRAVFDGATVPIYYESRLARLELKESERPKIDPEFEEATEGEEVERKEKLKSKWAQLEAVVGSDNRINLVARDLVEHFENRLAVMDGKAMVVVMSRRFAVELDRELVALRPVWHGEDDEHGALKVVMTGSASDPLDWQPHAHPHLRHRGQGPVE
jgi:type I site-specific restriction-modification system R (restriction) subunit